MRKLCCLLLLVGVSSLHAQSVDWPGFLGPTGDGKTSEKGLKPWPAEGPTLQWQLPLGEGYSAPIIHQGKCIIFDRVQNLVRCRAVAVADAKELWSFTYPTTYVDKYNYDGGPRACPVTDGQFVYLHGPEGMLHCINLSEGKLVWKVDTFAQFGVVSNFFGVGSTPLLHGDKLIVHVGGSPPESRDKHMTEAVSNDTALVAFDKTTGKVLYQCGHDLASYASPQVATLGGRKVGLIHARDGLVGFDPDQGKELFRHPFRARIMESVNVSNALVKNDQILLSESYAVGSTLLQYKDGTVATVWTAPPRRRDAGIAAHMNTPILVDSHVFGCTGRHPNEAELRCIDWATGKVAWRVQPQMGNDYVAGRGTLTYADGKFLYLAEEGVLFLLNANPEKYELLSVWDGRKLVGNKPLLPEPAWAAPVLSGGCIFLRGQGTLVCLRLYGK